MSDGNEPAQETSRTRTFSWADPHALARAGRDLSGLEYAQAIVEGRLPPPPIVSLMNMRLVEVAEGRAVFTVVPAEYHYNPIGSVHGGLAATLLDSATGVSVSTKLPRGTTYTTLELKINYLRPLTHETGEVRAEGHVIHIGRRTALAEGRIVDSAGKLYGFATATCLVLRP